MATVKSKSKKKKTQDWEKELEKLLKKLDKQKSATTRRTTLQAIHNVRYRKLTTDQRNKLSTTTTTKAKAAEAELRGLNRVVSGSVKKSKYQRKYTDEQRERIKAIREEEKQAKIKAREEAKEQRRIVKETLERIKEDKRRGREEARKKKEEERKAKEEAKRLKEEAKKKESTISEPEPESKVKSVEDDIQNGLERIENKIKELFGKEGLEEYKEGLANYGEYHNFDADSLAAIHKTITKEIEKMQDKYDLLKSIAEYKGMNLDNMTTMGKALHESMKGSSQFQFTWLIEVYKNNGVNGVHAHSEETEKKATKIHDILTRLSGIIQELPERIITDINEYLDQITDITIFRIQYDDYVSSDGIKEVHQILTNYDEELAYTLSQVDNDVYEPDRDEYRGGWGANFNDEV